MLFHYRLLLYLQSALISAFQQRNLNAFKYALENLGADPNRKDPRTDSSIFENILMDAKTSDYISLCIDNGADLYLVNIIKRKKKSSELSVNDDEIACRLLKQMIVICKKGFWILTDLMFNSNLFIFLVTVLLSVIIY